MRNRLFDVVNGEPVVTAPLINLSAFRKLWDSDTTEDKSVYKKWLMYIYYMYDYKSEFFEQKNKEEEILFELFGSRTYRVPSKKLKDCIKEYVDKNTCSEQRTLEAAISSADSVTDNLKKINKNANELDSILERLDKEIVRSLKEDNTVKAVELTKEKLELQTVQMNLIKQSSDLIPKIEKSVESIISLRDKVDRAINSLDESGDKLEDYIIDEFINNKYMNKYTGDD